MGIETGAFRVRVMPRLKIDGLLLKRLPVPRRKQHCAASGPAITCSTTRTSSLSSAVKFHVTMKVDSSIPAGLFDKSAESASSADGLSRSAKKVKRRFGPAPGWRKRINDAPPGDGPLGRLISDNKTVSL